MTMNRQAALGLLAAAGPTEDYAEGPAFRKEVVEAHEPIGKALGQ